MGTIQDILEPISGYLLNITRNPETGLYELEIGMPANWVFEENEDFTCEVLSENENGRLINIKPKYFDSTIDDLVQFVIVIIEINNQIKEEELQFQREIEEFKEKLENKAKNHYTKIDELKVTSFKSLGAALGKIKTPVANDAQPQKKERKPRAKLPIKPTEETQTIE